MSKFDEKFIKKYGENSDIGYIPEVDLENPKRLNNLHCDLPFLPEGRNATGFFVIFMIKTIMLRI